MKMSMRLLIAAVLFVAGCKVNDYCLECLSGDGGHGDGGGGGDANDGGITGDGSGSGSACVPTNGGVEICDGKDNDCNGLIDEGNLPEVGDACANQTGECAGGVKICTTKFHCSTTTTTVCHGASDTLSCPSTETCVAEGIDTDYLACSKYPTPEQCDNKDNDCNGLTDEGDPGGGSTCPPGATNAGECRKGTNHCVNGALQCQGYVGPTPEVCDTLDNDCNGMIDDGLTNMGSCGSNSTSPCQLGVYQCQGGAKQCVGAINPTFEACDGIDNDCNGIIDDGYNKQSDPNTCGNTCAVCQVPANSNANPTCTGGVCGFACKPGYQDKDGNPANGCEFGPCFPTGAEVCDGQDNDCDGNTDEGLTPPAICLSKGECAGTVAACTGATGWKCTYKNTVEVDSNGNVVQQETKCDTLDNDCDGAIDEGQPNLGQVCHDDKLGVCQTTGHYICDSTNISGPAICDNSNPGQTAIPEACDNVDNDCDGNVDEDMAQTSSTSPAVVGEDWVDIRGGRQMTTYEMSKPDASSSDAGSVTAHACSRKGVQPWVNVTYPQAVAACASIGATLCSEEEWHRTCSNILTRASTSQPFTIAAAGTYIEAEDFTNIASATSGGTLRSWSEDDTTGFFGASDMQVLPNTGANLSAANALAGGPRMDYLVTFPASGTYEIWARMYANSTGDNEVWVGVTATPPATPTNSKATSSTQAWVWMDIGAFSVPSGSLTRTIEVFMKEDGLRIDALYVASNGSTPTTTGNGAGGTWSYDAQNTTYAPTKCNGHDYDSTQDATLATGSLTNCTPVAFGDAGPYDLSGNVKEWTLAHQSGQNPIRGGASNNTSVGISCALNFTLADDTFFFSNVGFRCCRPKPP